MKKHNRIPYLKLNLSATGRTFVCGDLHGCFSLLEKELIKVNFNKTEDRLICVGDLIDRGPESAKALYYLEQSWFYSVLGNHEQLLLETLEHVEGSKNTWYQNGGHWFDKITSKQEEDKWYSVISKLPLTIEVVTRSGNVGIVHANIPDAMSWPDFIKNLKKGDWLCYGYATWGRQKKGTPDIEIKGVARVYAGHVVMSKIRKTQNFYQIDTGAFLNEPASRLSLVELTP